MAHPRGTTHLHPSKGPERAQPSSPAVPASLPIPKHRHTNRQTHGHRTTGTALSSASRFRPCLAPEPFFLGCQQPLPRGKEKLQGQCGRNPKPGEQPGEGGGASWQRTPFQTPDPVLGARARDVLVQGVSWGALSGGGGPKATSLRTRRMDITRPILPSGPLFNTFPRTARVFRT